MSEVRLSAEARTEFGKGGARRTRRAGLIPAVIYGHGADPRHVSLPAREFANAIRHGGFNVLLTLDLNGEEQLAIPKAIQRHAIKGTFDHVDLLAVRRGEKVTVDVPISIVGEIVAGGLLVQDASTVSFEAEATNIPSGVEVSIDGLEIGAQVTAADLDVPDGATLISEPDVLVLTITEAPTEADIEAETEAAVEDLGIVEEPAEGESAEDVAADEAKAASTEPVDD